MGKLYKVEAMQPAALSIAIGTLISGVLHHAFGVVLEQEMAIASAIVLQYVVGRLCDRRVHEAPSGSSSGSDGVVH